MPMFLTPKHAALVSALLIGGALATEAALAKPGAPGPQAAAAKKDHKDHKDHKDKSKNKEKDNDKDKAEERIAKMQERRSQALEEAGITGPRAKQVLDATHSVDQERLDLMKKVMEKRRALQALLDGGSKDDAAFAPLIAALRTLERNVAALRDRELDAMAKILKPSEIAKLLIARGWGDRGRRGEGAGN
ncbi:MAG: hypothetical protein SFV15_17765 [Polyangiaceae bacterium]|nr:hypothetical protein [Polyangiaceae bacterium]